MGAHPGLELPAPVEMERTKVLWDHLLQMEGVLGGTHFLKGKSKIAITDQGARTSLAPGDTGHRPSGNG